ncbi:MAG TPA: aldehyde dehydrogenase family protein [Solirubrobacteraceae bacterium]|jgi:RHH-type proline utilization regulon transcriptional repressor/proline dehydrogenase/delta 1-pyrroline-5-carboxylate dehydrogenase|nr:aldehyde dehydrogenase family protein [Solirubrobacteraceae bacterium]
MSEFVNEDQLELRRAPVRDALLDAGTQLARRFPLRVPILIADDRRDGEDLASLDPGHPDRIVADAPSASARDVDQALAAAVDGQREWGHTPPSERAQVLRRAADLLRERRLELAALAVYECAKPWVEADADVCEAIDFLRYYALQSLVLHERAEALTQPPGEHNALRYVGRGVTAVIAPWNFPLAIPTGMTAGALAAGNAVVLKPAPQSPACAHAIVTALRDAGVPSSALTLLPGGDEAGAALVEHPRTSVIAFTGSSAVGLDLIATAARTPPAQHHVKHVIAEMGGKNCVIVDSDADLDEAVPAIVHSAFGYAGQKCSAAARVLAHEAIAGPLTERLAGAVRSLRVGQADELGIDVPPVIDAAAQRRVRGFLEGVGGGGKVVGRGEIPQGVGFFCPPTLLADLPADSSILHEEVFGPVLSVEAVSDIAAACDLVDSLRFGLTGGLFSRNPATVRHVSERSPVGNLYVNREITGAMVGRQPFGGRRLSGTGGKAGGPDYLLEFVQSLVVCENTTRHGLVV